MTFTFRPAIRDASPLLIGLVGPSGCGKTRSALELATGIRELRGGKIVGLDTEAGRMKHYAPKNGEKADPARGTYDFLHASFGAPFSSDRYTEALTECAREAAGGVVIIDSQSHEHEGQGGYLEYHEAELDRMAGDDWKKRERMTFTGWIKPAAARRRLINTLLQIDCAFVFCFRAKEKLRIVRGQEPIQTGWQAIAGDEFVYEMTVRCLLPPGAMGVPDWSEDAFKYGVAKREDAHVPILPNGERLSVKTGRALAEWVSGAPVVTLDQVCAAISTMTDEASQGAAKALASRLTGEDVKLARKAWVARLEELKGEPI